MNVLFIGGDGNKPTANTVCIGNMAHEMSSRGHKVYILSMGDDYVANAGIIDGIELWQIPDSYYGRLITRVTEHPSLSLKLWYRFFSVLRHFLIIPFYPNVAPLRARKVEKKAKDLVESRQIELVVCIFNCYDNIFAGMYLKRLLGDRIKVVSYHLDLRTGSINPSAIIRHKIFKQALRSLVEENRIMDKMLIPYSGKKDIEYLKNFNIEKVFFVGFPVFLQNSEDTYYNCQFNKNDINICYIGSLSVDNRNPQYILDLLERVSSFVEQRIVIHFWGNLGGLESIIEKYQNVIYHGSIDNIYVRHIMNESDFLLNIGNKIAYQMLPSKIFGMFATGKPIINVIGHPDDATMPYFSCYNNSIDIKEYEPSVNDEELLLKKIKEKYKTPLVDRSDLFSDFKPEVICNLLLQ